MMQTNPVQIALLLEDADPLMFFGWGEANDTSSWFGTRTTIVIDAHAEIDAMVWLSQAQEDGRTLEVVAPGFQRAGLFLEAFEVSTSRMRITLASFKRHDPAEPASKDTP